MTDLQIAVTEFLGRPDSNETPKQRKLLYYYASIADSDGRFSASLPKIMKATGLKRTVLKAANRRFHDLGILQWRRGWGNRATGDSGEPNKYHLTLQYANKLKALEVAGSEKPTIVKLAWSENPPPTNYNHISIHSTDTYTPVDSAVRSNSNTYIGVGKPDHAKNTKVGKSDHASQPSPARPPAPEPAAPPDSRDKFCGCCQPATQRTAGIFHCGRSICYHSSKARGLQ